MSILWQETVDGGLQARVVLHLQLSTWNPHIFFNDNLPGDHHPKTHWPIDPSSRYDSVGIYSGVPPDLVLPSGGSQVRVPQGVIFPSVEFPTLVLIIKESTRLEGGWFLREYENYFETTVVVNGWTMKPFMTVFVNRWWWWWWWWWWSLLASVPKNLIHSTKSLCICIYIHTFLRWSMEGSSCSRWI